MSQEVAATSRLKTEYMRLKRYPIPYITAEPLPNNILEWHYVIKGTEDTPYFGGYYYGKLVFPPEYPFLPPSIYMITPNGRFKTNTRLCLSMSDFHPEKWNSSWQVGTLLMGLLSFMNEAEPTKGSIETTITQKMSLAKKSLEFNIKNQQFRELFPEICEEISARLQIEQGPANGGNSFNNRSVGATDNMKPKEAELWMNKWLLAVCIASFALFLFYCIK